MVAAQASLGPKCNAQPNRLARQTHVPLEGLQGCRSAVLGSQWFMPLALACLPCPSGYFLPFAVVSSLLCSASTGALLTRIGSAAFLAGSIGLYALAWLAQPLAPRVGTPPRYGRAGGSLGR
jgi:hypothetical protein